MNVPDLTESAEAAENRRLDLALQTVAAMEEAGVGPAALPEDVLGRLVDDLGGPLTAFLLFEQAEWVERALAGETEAAAESIVRLAEAADPDGAAHFREVRRFAGDLFLAQALGDSDAPTTWAAPPRPPISRIENRSHVINLPLANPDTAVPLAALRRTDGGWRWVQFSTVGAGRVAGPAAFGPDDADWAVFRVADGREDGGATRYLCVGGPPVRPQTLPEERRAGAAVRNFYLWEAVRRGPEEYRFDDRFPPELFFLFVAVGVRVLLRQLDDWLEEQDAWDELPEDDPFVDWFDAEKRQWDLFGVEYESRLLGDGSN